MPATKTKTNAAKLAPRLKTLDGARLGLYLARPDVLPHVIKKLVTA